MRVEELRLTLQSGPSEPLTEPAEEANNKTVQLEVFCGLQSLGIVEAGELIASTPAVPKDHFRQFSCDADMRLTARNLAKHAQTFLISYDTESKCK